MLWDAVLPGVILLGLVIFVHELGHFLVAKWRGVKVLRFSLGFGPAIVKFTRGETEYMIAWFPLGGYVQMAGDSPVNVSETEKLPQSATAEPERRAADDGEADPKWTMPNSREEFLSHPWYGRIMICLAGPGANLITAFLVMVLVGLVGVSYPDYPNQLGSLSDTSYAHRLGLRSGDRIVAVAGNPVKSWAAIYSAQMKVADDRPVEVQYERDGSTATVNLVPDQRRPFFTSLKRPPTPPIVGSVVTAMPAYKAGLKEGDRILAVNGKPISSWEELPPSLRGMVDRPVVLDVQREKRRIRITVTPMSMEGRGTQDARIGIEAPHAGTYVERHSLLESIDLGFRATTQIVATVYGGMWLTVSRPLYYREYIGGPLYIAQAAREQARRGFDSYLQFLALINIAIMAFNLMPLPMLDGGHILLALIEAVRRQAISARAYLRFQKVGLVVMGTLFVLILANDPLRLVQRQRALGNTNSPAPQEQPVAPP